MYKMLFVATLVTCNLTSTVLKADEAEAILAETGVQGGLIVHLGCGDGRLTASLHVSEGYLVHGLDASAENVAIARENVRSQGLYGDVSIDLQEGATLPYADNLVNLLVVEDSQDVSLEEFVRVLAPGGSLCRRKSDNWEIMVKPRPEEIDEWTHHLHGPGGNPVSKDDVVGPPHHIQWTAGPTWARSHGYTPSVTSMVSSNGRFFAIVDETIAGASDAVPSKWMLVARDAFNGVLLWKTPVPNWGSYEMSGLLNSGEGVSVGRFTMPPQAAKRLVAVDNMVYVTLGAQAPVSAIDGATGEVKQVYEGTERTDEILINEGRLILAINPDPSERPPFVESGDTPPAAFGKRIRVFDASSGETLWKAGPFSATRAGRAQDPFGRLELSSGEGKVFALTAERLECFDIESGDEKWSLDRPALPDNAVRRLGFSGMYEYQLAVVVYHEGVLLFAQPEPNTHHTYHTMPGTLYAFDAESGEVLWNRPYGGWGHCTQPDVFVANGTVWTHVDAETEYGSVWGSGFRASDTSIVDYRIQGIDLRTGEVTIEHSTRDIYNVGHHHRCYRNKSTERFLLASRRGVEFVDLETGENFQNHWVRSGCKVGNMPCNGLIYVAPHPCGCYITAKLTGFNALAASIEPRDVSDLGETSRLEQGPAYGLETPVEENALPEWATYRGDARRSGSIDANIPTDLSILWQSPIGERLSAPTVANGMVFVANVDGHEVISLNASDGERVWSRTTSGRVACPPTIVNGLAIFGSADGNVYSVRAADGALNWRFKAASSDRLIVGHNQLESAWPVPGVLVQDDACWFAAGRSSYLDGGIRVYAIDPKSGALLHEETIDDNDPETGKMTPEPSANTMVGLLNDVPGSDGVNVFLRQQVVSSETAKGDGQHLYTSGGYLDSSWFNRTFWKVDGAQTTGPMVLGDGVSFGVEPFTSRSRDVLFEPGKNSYRLRCFALDRRNTGETSGRSNNAKNVLWDKQVGIRIEAMVLTGETLFAVGSPDIIDPNDPHGAWEGRQGGLLAAYSIEDGEQLATIELPAPPVWDGMAATGGRLYISLVDGSVVCLE